MLTYKPTYKFRETSSTLIRDIHGPIKNEGHSVGLVGFYSTYFAKRYDRQQQI
jgi:hypothetical protein